MRYEVSFSATLLKHRPGTHQQPGCNVPRQPAITHFETGHVSDLDFFSTK